MRVGYGAGTFFGKAILQRAAGQHLAARRYSSNAPAVPDRESDGLLTFEET